MPTRAGLLDLSTPKLVNDLLRSSLALRFSSMLCPWQLWLRDTPEQKFSPTVPHTHQCGACILRASFLCLLRWPSAIEAQQGRAGNRPKKEMAPARGGTLRPVEVVLRGGPEAQA